MPEAASSSSSRAPPVQKDASECFMPWAKPEQLSKLESFGEKRGESDVKVTIIREGDVETTYYYRSV